MIPQRGPFIRASIFGVPLLVHWSLPLLDVLVAFVPFMYRSGKSALISGVVISLSVMALVLVHEFGHALAAASCGVKVEGIVLSARGGACLVERPSSIGKNAVILCGGVVAQLIVFLITAAFINVLGAPRDGPLIALVFVFLGINVFYMLISALPMHGSDGSKILDLLRGGQTSV
jgi:Zn-dependent protease